MEIGNRAEVCRPQRVGHGRLVAEIFAREGIMLTAQLQIQPGLRRRDADFGGATYG